MNSYRILFLAFTLLLISALRHRLMKLLPVSAPVSWLPAWQTTCPVAASQPSLLERQAGERHQDNADHAGRYPPDKGQGHLFLRDSARRTGCDNARYRRSLDAGAVTGSLFYSLFGKEWRNPYLVGSRASDTTVYNYGGKLVFEEISGTPLSAEIKTTVKKVEHEDLTGDLRRNGVLVETGLSWQESLGAAGR